MLINQLQHKLKKNKRVGRGGKRGTFSGKGTKGQKSRAGAKIRPAMRDVIIRMPKRRGFKFNTSSEKPFVVNIGEIAKRFDDGEVVSFETLKEKKVLNVKKSERKKSVKILSMGIFDKKLTFASELSFSKVAEDKIKKAGSTIASK